MLILIILLSVTDEVMDFWKGLRASVYGSFTDHPRYNWQFRPGISRKGSIKADENFYKAIETLVETAPEMQEILRLLKILKLNSRT